MNNRTVPPIDRERIRAQFPALASDTIFLENAGGSQMPKVVADRMHDYMLYSYVQLDAGYELSNKATRIVEEAHDFISLFMNGARAGKVCGAGGGGCLVFLCPRDRREAVARRLEAAGLERLPVRVARRGLRVRTRPAAP